MAKLRYRLTVADLVAAGRAHYRNNAVRRLWAPTGRGRLFRIGAVIFLVLVLLDLAFNDTGGNRLYIVLGVLSFALAILFSYFVQIPIAARKMFEQQKALQSDIEADWDEARISWRSAHWNASLGWSDYVAFLERDGMVMLYQTDIMYQIAPARAFASEADRADLVARLEAAGVRREGKRSRLQSARAA